MEPCLEPEPPPLKTALSPRTPFDYLPKTPVAIVVQAGYAGKERVIEGTLGTILNQVGQKDLPFEYRIYVGDFLAYRHKKAR